MMTVIVDTNVPKVANGREESHQASCDCVNICRNRAEGIIRGEEKLVLDDEWIILSEYMNNLRSSGEPGTGDRFLKWVLANKDTQCDLVQITSVGGLVNEFEEFPDDSGLEGFDDDDRKFVAVSCAHPDNPPILQAVDEKWRDFLDALQENGVRVDYICEDYVQNP